MGACSPISIRSDFEGGSLGKVERLGEAEFLCHLAGQADHEGRNRQVTWYAFRIDGAKGREVTLRLSDLRGEYDYKPAAIAINGDAPPVVSTDGMTWRHHSSLAFEKEKEQAVLKVTPDSDAFWVAHIELYTPARLDRLLAEVRGHPALQDEVIGKSVEGRDLHLLTIRDPAAGAGAGERPVIWLMCRQHAWESGTSFVGEGAVRYLLSDDAKALRRRVIFKVLPMMDPDGCARGGVRFNRNGYDVNRNWDTADPKSAESRRLMPEICAAKEAILKDGRIDLFLTLHNQEVGGWLSGSERHKDFTERFWSALLEKTAFNPNAKTPRYSKETPAKGRATVYQYFEGEHGKRAFILEQGIAFDSKLGRLPTSQDRLAFGAQLAKTMGDVVLEK